MKIILIPCSGSKVHGGQSNPQPSKLADRLSAAALQKLMSARQELEAILQDAQSSFGFKKNEGRINTCLRTKDIKESFMPKAEYPGFIQHSKAVW